VRDVVFPRAVGKQFRFGPVPFGDERPALRRIGEGVFGPLPFFYGKLDLVFVLGEDVRVNAGHMVEGDEIMNVLGFYRAVADPKEIDELVQPFGVVRGLGLFLRFPGRNHGQVDIGHVGDL